MCTCLCVYVPLIVSCLCASVFACVSCMLHGSPHSLAATQLKSSGTVQTHPLGTSSAPEFPSPHAWGHPYSFPPLIWGKWWKAGFFPISYFLPRLPAFQCNANLQRPENTLPFGHDQFHVISITPCQEEKERPRVIIVIIQCVTVRLFVWINAQYSMSIFYSHNWLIVKWLTIVCIYFTQNASSVST